MLDGSNFLPYNMIINFFFYLLGMIWLTHSALKMNIDKKNLVENLIYDPIRRSS